MIEKKEGKPLKYINIYGEIESCKLDFIISKKEIIAKEILKKCQFYIGFHNVQHIMGFQLDLDFSNATIDYMYNDYSHLEAESYYEFDKQNPHNKLLHINDYVMHNQNS